MILYTIYANLAYAKYRRHLDNYNNYNNSECNYYDCTMISIMKCIYINIFVKTIIMKVNKMKIVVVKNTVI